MTIWKAIIVSIILAFFSTLIYSLLDILKLFMNLGHYQYKFYQIFTNIVAQTFSFLIIKKIFFSKEELSLKKVPVNIYIFIVLILFVFGDIFFQYGFNNIQDIIFKTNVMGNKNGGNIPFSYFVIRLVKGCLVAPLVEELFFRKFIQENLAKRYSYIFAVISASVLFSLYHRDLGSFFQIFIFGIGLGMVFLETRRIEYSIIFHSVSNFMIYSFNYYYKDESIQNNSNNLIYTAIGLATIITGIYILKRKNNLY
ncbi:CPBP family intramembrane metalloprotease [Chryseobacterium sp. SSA4.19]|uniref:CPBP family intramembrane glutamic endopeptidase n=1 Tax=Chryseobacterium sp. SSA4.19 TaxID=2919915 RepID=UPI001F4ED184|nr:type II CAAX endopeptidase family protein [Chryseobacterium sp. SSA4.19]MCJ8152321.1 CPBP family intramembrane metalloprotease [Chryseobacterium sp. SSA4.19]